MRLPCRFFRWGVFDSVAYVLNRRSNHILAARPFAQIIGPAALAAEGEISVRLLNGLFANRTFEPGDVPSHLGMSILDGIVQAEVEK